MSSEIILVDRVKIFTSRQGGHWALVTDLNNFLATLQKPRAELVGIQYAPVVLNDGSVIHSALVHYKEAENGGC